MRKVALVALLLLAGCRVFTDDSGSGSSLSLTPDERPTATITMQAASAAFIGSGQGGEGTLYFQGKAYPFYVGGLGIGGIGASTIEATGDVFRLQDIADFPGAYSQVRYGAVVGTASAGEMWLNNPQGVVIHLDTKRTGLMLSLGGDAMVLTLK
ncbi:MAG: hypothetical protein U1E42_08175 [Rhodospirillales bacterium]